jgi:uncharacterized iron-regulated membrane protein
VDFRALGAAVDRLAAATDEGVSSVWTSGTGAGRFDIHYTVGGSGRVMRVDGQGQRLRDRNSDAATADGAIWDSITSIHTSLMAGDGGKWLIGISGLLLLSNILLGLKLAWPKRRTLGKILFGRPTGGPAARLYGWHRKVGLWIAFPAMLTVSAGVLMVFSDGVERALGAGLPDPVVTTAGPVSEPVGFGAAVGVALKVFPRATFSGASLPSEDAPWYRVRVRNAGELPRKWGTSVVYVAATDGVVLSTYDAARPRAGRAIVDTLYALHTGQAGGTLGRLIVLAIGMSLLALIGLGLPLWWTRRKLKTGRSPGHRQREHLEAVGPTQG